jgi:hypothetical protein
MLSVPYAVEVFGNSQVIPTEPVRLSALADTAQKVIRRQKQQAEIIRFRLSIRTSRGHVAGMEQREDPLPVRRAVQHRGYVSVE